MIGFFRILLVLLSLSLISCGESSLLLTLSDSENAVIIKTSIDNGVILDPDLGEKIDISLEYDETLVIPAKLEISFLDEQGLEIDEPKIIEGDALNAPLPSISLASPLEAKYSIRLRVFDNDDIIIKEEIISFFYSRSSLSIRGLTPFPNVFEPGGLGLIFFDADGTEDSWVRWSIDNEIIEEGYFTEYTDGFIWKAPVLEGVYGLRMELFPVEPLYTKDGTFSFTSPLRSELEVFVTALSESDPTDLYPSESYSTIIHFKGIVVDSGADKKLISDVGHPVIKRQGDKFGYYLKEGSGYLLNGNILPLSNNLLMPFSVTFSYCLDNPQLDAYFLNITDDNDILFSIKTDISGVILSELFQDGMNIISNSGIFPENYNEITLSVIPEDKSITFLWYGDGLLQFSDIYDYNPKIPNSIYKSAIGVENGFEGLIDEFGIYYIDEKGQNNIDDNIFQRRSERKYNPDRIIAAYGFDGLYFDEINNSSLSVSRGSVILDYNSSFQFLETDFNFSYLYIDIDFEDISETTEIEISFPDMAGENNIHINLDDLLLIDNADSFIEIELNVENGVLSVLSKGEIITEVFLEIYTPAVFKIVNNSEESETKIASILVRREEKRVVEDKQLNIKTEL
ncbi:MAG: hypothetical protein KAQ93_00490 [Spirochaetales bacterium]|nr:hypothetical protein [Spirochaetales bacterium]